jgi:hypothetical protein
MNETVATGRGGLRPTLFRRLRRYSPTPGRDAREDRLTEALAATFEAAPHAARHLVDEWFQIRAEGTLTVATQKRVRPGERLDIELVFGPLNRRNLTVWLEAKVGAIPYRDQVARYLDALQSVSGEHRLSWLLPVDREVHGGTPDGVLERSWLDVAVALNRWLRQLDPGELPLYPAMIVREFVEHLEEEGLAVTQPLTSEDVAAVEGYQVAEKRINELLRLAGAMIHRQRPSPRGGARPPAGLGFWEHVEHDASWPADAFFEWRGTHDGLRDHPVGAFAIGAGVSWERGNEPSERDLAEWFQRRYDEGFERGESRHHMVYLLRYRSLTDLVAAIDQAPASGIDEQARVLADWSLASWAMLDADPLPPTV